VAALLIYIAGKKQGISMLADLTVVEPEKSKPIQRLAQEIPCAAEQEIFSHERGIFFTKTAKAGNLLQVAAGNFRLADSIEVHKALAACRT
jgi:hypothetical protein